MACLLVRISSLTYDEDESVLAECGRGAHRTWGMRL